MAKPVGIAVEDLFERALLLAKDLGHVAVTLLAAQPPRAAQQILMGAKAPAPTFVELLTPQAISCPECTIEMEGRRGTVRIQLKGASTSDLAGLSRVLWEVAS